jgi:hypothetical protein
MASRILSGICGGGTVTGYVLLVECCDTDSRSFAGGCAWGIWTLWVACVPLAAFIVDSWYAHARQEAVPWMSSWRLLCVAVALPNFTILLAAPFLVESPRFLAGCGQADKAWGVLSTMASWNGRSLPSGVAQSLLLVQEGGVKKGQGPGPAPQNQLEQGRQERQLQQAVGGGPSGSDDVEEPPPPPPTASLSTLFRTDLLFGVPMWCITCSVAYLWLATNVVYYVRVVCYC